MPILKKMLPRAAWDRTRRLQRETAFTCRRATWYHRPLPDFIVIGAQKSGTTSLHNYLSQHPQLAASWVKEVHYFDGGLSPGEDTFKNGPAWYRAHFPLAIRQNRQRKIFETSPLYLFNPLVPERLAALIPTIKLVVLLRNPTERAISHWFHEQHFGCEFLPIMAALEEEEKRVRPVLQIEDYKSEAFIHHTYKSRGLYYDQLKRYRDYFPAENFFIANSERFFSEPADTMRRIFTFLEVDPEITVGDLTARNVAGNKTKVNPEVHQYLDNYFRIPNRQLRDLVGREYGW
jgi:hypothetical protein